MFSNTINFKTDQALSSVFYCTRPYFNSKTCTVAVSGHSNCMLVDYFVQNIIIILKRTLFQENIATYSNGLAFLKSAIKIS